MHGRRKNFSLNYCEFSFLAENFAPWKMRRRRNKKTRSLKRVVFYFQTNICCSRSRNETNVRRALKYFSLTWTARQLIKDLRLLQTSAWATLKNIFLVNNNPKGKFAKKNFRRDWNNFQKFKIKVSFKMMKTLTMPSSADESVRMHSPQEEIKSTKIQEILGINNENGNVGSTNASIESR